MSNNKLILLEVVGFLVLYVLFYNIARHSKLTPSDAAGSGMERGYRVLLVIAIFFIIAIALTITNYFLLKKVTNTEIKFMAYIPIVSSVGHILYTILFG